MEFCWWAELGNKDTTINTKIVSEYDHEIHNHKRQTNRWHREEEPHNNHETPGRQTKQSNHLSFPNPDDCKTRNVHKVNKT